MISIRVPISSELHAHAKGHWRSKAKATASARFMASMLVRKPPNEPIHGVVVVRYRFIVPDRRRRDVVNMMQSCKPYIDGIVDAKFVDGDHWEVMRVAEPTVEVGVVDGVEVVIEIRSKDKDDGRY